MAMASGPVEKKRAATSAREGGGEGVTDVVAPPVPGEGSEARGRGVAAHRYQPPFTPIS